MGADYNSHFLSMYTIFIQQLQLILPQGTNIPAAYEQGSDDEQAFVQNLALFFTAFFRVCCHIKPHSRPTIRAMIFSRQIHAASGSLSQAFKAICIILQKQGSSGETEAVMTLQCCL